MTLEELQKESLFALLTKQQREFVAQRCLGEDKISAAKAAWNCTTDESAAAMANRAERNGNIRWLIQEFHGGNLPTAEDVKKLIWKTALAAEDIKDRLKALELYAKISGMHQADVSVTPPTPGNEPDDSDEPFDAS